MPEKIKHILAGVGVALGTLYIVWGLTLVKSRRGELPCAKFDVVVTDSADLSFISRAGIRRYVALSGNDPTGRAMSEVNTDVIEHLLDDNPMIRSAQCYKTNGDRVLLKIKQRKPKFRVMGDVNYYVDTERQIMPVSTEYSAYVPVVTGVSDHSLAQTVVYDFVDYITGDEFWDAQVEQIAVSPDTTITLVPRVGNHVIILGKPVRIKQKLAKMMTLYEKGFTIAGWPDYKTIDLRIRNQIICKK